MKQLRVALFMHLLNISDKITEGRLVIQAILANSGIFLNPNPGTVAITTAIDDLANAEQAAKDGGKINTKKMHDLERKVVNVFKSLAQYVEDTADGDIAIVHLAGMEERKHNGSVPVDFKIVQGDGHGIIKLRVKPQAKTIYKWQYAVDPAGAWIDIGRSDVSNYTANNIPTGVYWFRAIFVDALGDHEGTPVNFAVN